MRVAAAHLEDLETCYARGREQRDLLGFGRAGLVSPVDDALVGGERALVLEGPDVVGRRLDVRHVHERRDAADGGRGRGGEVVLLVLVAGHPGMRVQVHKSGKDVHSGNVDGVGGGSRIGWLDEAGDAFPADQQIGGDWTARSMQSSVTQTQIGFGHGQVPACSASARWKSGAEGA